MEYLNMFLFILLISITKCSFINETTSKIKEILSNYKICRTKRCADSENVDNSEAFENTLNLLTDTERVGDFFRHYNVSDCDSGKDNLYRKDHVINGLLINHNIPDSHWHEYKSVFNKEYASSYNESEALSRWRNNLRRVAYHNRQYLAGKVSYSLHLNQFGDMQPLHYIKKILKLIETQYFFDPAEDRNRRAYHSHKHKTIPSRVDWRAAGFNPRREEQWQCGACYAFAVTHALQAQLFKKNRNWKELSPQQIVDCSHNDGNMGCDGGSLRGALRYAARDGIASETFYPYIGKRGPCRYTFPIGRVRPKRWATLPSGDEAAMERAIATIGPLAVAVNAAPVSFQLYRSGIYDDVFCTPWKMNHAMLLVGYTPQYWILLNWWGRNWGEDGYIRIKRGFNRCGVANMATYVEL